VMMMLINNNKKERKKERPYRLEKERYEKDRAIA